MTPLQTVQALLNLDEEHAPQVEIEKAVNRAKEVVNLLPLTPHRGAFSGELEYRTFSSFLTDWEEDATFVDGSYSTIVPAVSDFVKGVWTFSSEPTRPVYISGTTVDVYQAGAMVLDRLANSTGEDLSSFSGQNGAFSLAGKSSNYRRLAQTFRSQQRIRTVVMERVDLA